MNESDQPRILTTIKPYPDTRVSAVATLLVGGRERYLPNSWRLEGTISALSLIEWAYPKRESDSLKDHGYRSLSEPQEKTIAGSLADSSNEGEFRHLLESPQLMGAGFSC